MDKRTLELYLYMGSTEPILKWLKEEKVTTRKEALDKLEPLVQSNIISSISLGGCLAGTANAVKKIVDTFPLENK